MGASSVRPLTNGGTLTTDFPTVHPQNWCGEYQPKPERNADANADANAVKRLADGMIDCLSNLPTAQLRKETGR